MAADPPIIETGVSFQFDPLNWLTALDLAGLYQRFSGRFAAMQHAPYLPAMSASPGEIVFSAQHSLLPRTWLVTSDLHYVFQVQADRVSLSWRRISSEGPAKYPGFDEIASKFRDCFAIFEEWAKDHGTILALNTGELFRQNAIPLIAEDGSQIRLSTVFAVFNRSRATPFINFSMNWAEALADQNGFISMEAGAANLSDGRPAVMVNLSGRRTVAGLSFEDAMASIETVRPHMDDMFREVISEAFQGPKSS